MDMDFALFQQVIKQGESENEESNRRMYQAWALLFSAPYHQPPQVNLDFLAKWQCSRKVPTTSV